MTVTTMTTTPTMDLVISTIVSAVALEKIFLLGYLDTKYNAANIFQHDRLIQDDALQFIILVLPKANDQQVTRITGKIENRCASIIPVISFVIPFLQFKNMLAAGHPFATRVMSAGCCVYDAHGLHLPIPSSAREKYWQLRTIKEIMNGHLLGRSFLSGAAFHRAKGQYLAMCFSLHQAVEQFYLLILQGITGLRLASHDILKLQRYCRVLSSKVFWNHPFHREEAEKLFRDLQDAYVDARYDCEFSNKGKIKPELVDVAKKLQALAENIMKQKMETTVRSA